WTLGGNGGELFWEGGDDFGVDVLRFYTCLTDILGFLEKFRWWFEQDIEMVRVRLNNEQKKFGDVIMEYLVKDSKRRAFWSLNEDILEITILKTNTPYPSRKIRRIRACTHQRPRRNKINTPYPEEVNTPGRSTDTSDGLAAKQAELNNLGREIKKVSEKVYAAQVGCEQCKGPHYTKDCPLKEEGKTIEESYYTQFGGPFQSRGYRVTTLGFYQRNNANPSYQERRQSMEDTLSKFMGESAKRHEENSNLIKEI
ncbi:hypothetical protein Tco_1147756, partial [Tanacetum coccineum]